MSHIKCKWNNVINCLDEIRWNFSFSRDGMTCDYGSRLAFRIIFVGEIRTRAIKFRNIDGLPVRKRDNWLSGGGGAKFARPLHKRTPRSIAYCIRRSPATITVPAAYLSSNVNPSSPLPPSFVINRHGKNGIALTFFEFRPNFSANDDKRRRNLWPPRKVSHGSSWLMKRWR